MTELTVMPGEGGRLDSFLAEKTDLSRSAAARLCEEGAVFVGGKAQGKKYALREGEIVSFSVPEAVPTEAKPENIPLNIVFEDKDIVVIKDRKSVV